MNRPDQTTSQINVDAYAPAEIARRVETAGLAKVDMAILPTLALSVLAGAFIAFGAMYFTMVMTGHGLGFGPSRALGGLTFSLGLILVVIAGAELFTGNNLIAIACAGRKTSTAKLLRNWVLVYAGNFAGSTAAIIVSLTGVMAAGD